MDTFIIRGQVEGHQNELVIAAEEKDVIATYNGAVAAGMRPIAIVPSYEPEGPAHSIYECEGYTFSTCPHGDCLIITNPKGTIIADGFEELAAILKHAGYGRKE